MLKLKKEHSSARCVDLLEINIVLTKEEKIIYELKIKKEYYANRISF